MKKKFLALATLLCSATVCATAGAMVMNNANVQTVNAEATTSDWTDTATGKKYYFEGDTKVHNAKDIRDYNMHDMLKTSEGVTDYVNAPHWYSTFDNQFENVAVVKAEDAAWVTQSGGVKFKFKSHDYWTGKSSINEARFTIVYGDLCIKIFPYANTNGELNVFTYNASSQGTQVKVNGSLVYITDNFWLQGTDNNHMYMDDWATLSISKYDCTSVSDGSTPTGYWLKVSLEGASGPDRAQKTRDLINQYIPNDMSNATWNDFAIVNSTVGAYANVDATSNMITNPITIKSTYETATATLDTETYKDVADMTDTQNHNYVAGWGSASTSTYNTDQIEFAPASTADSMGFEMRARENFGKLNTYQTTYPSDQRIEKFMGLYAGFSHLVLTYKPAYKSIAIWGYNYASGNVYLAETVRNIPYDLDATYVWRLTRSVLRESGQAKGALLNLYMGKINATTNMPEEGWDAKPMVSIYDAGTLKDTTQATWKHGLGMNGYNITNRSNYQHNMWFESNKYVALTTDVNGTQTVNKVQRNVDFALTPVAQENVIHVGWSKGAAAYSANDFVAPNGMVNINKNATVKALTMTLDADEKASMRFRKRGENPMEVSLNWKVVSSGVEALMTYFGEENVSLGYKLTADMMTTATDDDVSTEEYVDKFVDGYNYSITQSNITDEYYTMNLVCQAFVEINDVKYYTADVNMEENGRSVNFVAQSAVDDAREEQCTDNGVEYKNAITTADGTRYHYLTQSQYNLLVDILN